MAKRVGIVVAIVAALALALACVPAAIKAHVFWYVENRQGELEEFVQDFDSARDTEYNGWDVEAFGDSGMIQFTVGHAGGQLRR